MAGGRRSRGCLLCVQRRIKVSASGGKQSRVDTEYKYNGHTNEEDSVMRNFRDALDARHMGDHALAMTVASSLWKGSRIVLDVARNHPRMGKAVGIARRRVLPKLLSSV